MDQATVTFIAGVISCIIGVSTFITGRMARAERNGSMETKINQALDGITTINRKIEDFSNSQHSIELLVKSHEEQIKTLFRHEQSIRDSIENSDKTREVLIELLQVIRGMK